MANSHTLPTFFSGALGRADIEVPSVAVDMDSRATPACYPQGNFWPMSPAFLIRTVGSLSSAFAPARLVGLAVKPAFAFTRSARFPSGLSRP